MNSRRLSFALCVGCAGLTLAFVTTVAGCADPQPQHAVEDLEGRSTGATMLVSDIDDTVKATGIHDGGGVVIGALSTIREFAGMSILYTGWRKLDARSKSITYLSAAPDAVISLGVDFLRQSQFPGNGSDIGESVVGGRGLDESAGSFKGRKLIEMWEGATKKPATMILVGDNGEEDMEGYRALIDHIESVHGSTRVHSFIHHVYESSGKGTPITAPHTAFLTSADLAVRFHEAGWIDEATLARVTREVAVDSDPNDSLFDTVIPSFVECSQFDAWPTLAVGAESATTTAYATVKTNVKALCTR